MDYIERSMGWHGVYIWRAAFHIFNHLRCVACWCFLHGNFCVPCRILLSYSTAFLGSKNCYHTNAKHFFCFAVFIALFSHNNSIHMIYTSCMCIFKLWNSIRTIFNCHKATGVHQKPERKEDQQWMSSWKWKKMKPWSCEHPQTQTHTLQEPMNCEHQLPWDRKQLIYACA